MNVEKLFNWVQRVGVALLLTLMAGCGGPGTAEETTGGTISMPLTGTAPSGVQYRLTFAAFSIQGPESLTATSQPDEPVLNIDVAPGSYTVTLLDGWGVERFAGGTWTSVDAVLTSSPVVALTVAQGVISQATFSFGVGDDFITFGKGRISIGATFDDGSVANTEITLAATNRGWWNSQGSHSSLNLNTLTGDLYNSEYRSFFTFDVSGTPVGVIGATLRLEIENVNSPDAETATISDVSTSAAELAANGANSATDIAIFDDLGTGSAYGSFAVDASSVGAILDIPLSGAVLADLNAATTTFSVGVSLDVIELDEWIRFSSSSEPRVHELVMQYPSP